jgi:hypothetical protein
MAINTIGDRAEGYFQLGLFYNQNKKYSHSYEVLKYAKGISFQTVQDKYILFLNKHNYSKFINDELSVSCFWLGKYTEGKNYLDEILHDQEFEHCRERLLQNEKYFNVKLKLKTT